MIYRLAYKNLLRSPIMNALMILQMVIIFFIAICVTSSITSRFSYYLPLKDILKSDSDYYSMFYAADPETGVVGTTSQQLEESMNGNPEIHASYIPWLYYKETEINEDISILSFDNLWIEIYSPQISDGTWFDLQNWSKDTIPIVVSQNNNNFKVGDKITLTSYGTEKNISCEIVGSLAEGARILGYDIPSDGNVTCKNLYQNYYHSIEEETLIIMPQSMINTDVINTQLHGPFLITYPSNSDDTVRETNNIYLKQMQVICGVTTDEIHHNSIAYIFEQCTVLLPILIAVLIMTLVSTMSVNALSAKRQIHNYMVYSLCGLPWSKCVLINLLTSSYLVVFSLALSLFSVLVLTKTSLFEESVIELGVVQVLVCIMIALIYVLFSMIMPFQIIHNHTLNQILREN